MPFNNAANSLSSSLADHSLLTSKPEITRLDFSSSIFSALEGTLSCSYSITITSFDTVSNSRGRPAGRREGYGAGRIDLEPLETLEHAVGKLSAVKFIDGVF